MRLGGMLGNSGCTSGIKSAINKSPTWILWIHSPFPRGNTGSSILRSISTTDLFPRSVGPSISHTRITASSVLFPKGVRINNKTKNHNYHVQFWTAEQANSRVSWLERCYSSMQLNSKEGGLHPSKYRIPSKSELKRHEGKSLF